MGEANFTYTEADHLEANRLNIRVTLRSWKSLRAVGVLWAIYAVLAVGIVAMDGLTVTGVALALSGSLVLTLLVVAGIRGTNAVLLPRRSRRLFQQQKALHRPMSVQWDAAGIALQMESGNARYAWGDFVKWAEGPHGINLYQNDLLYNLLPKRVLDPGQIEEIRAALATHGVPRKG